MSTEINRGAVSKLLTSVTSIRQIIRLIGSLSSARQAVTFGVAKREGVSIDRERKEANQAAIDLLNSLQDGANLTVEERKVLAGYTGEGGIGGSEYEYFTPQAIAEGIWDLVANYGIAGGLGLEPSAGTGVFQETKPHGVIMQSAEISPISGRINQMLHPEDSVSIAPFEELARRTPDNTFDHCVGNVPFGKSRGGFAERDPAYKQETLAGYFVLRPIDKVKPGGLIVLIVPNGLTHNASEKKLRERVSRKAEFLGAHRLPSGTFANNGTATVVDVWVLRKHTEEVAELVLNGDEQDLRSTNVLWDTFIMGKWFEREGRRFIHGEMSVEGKDKFARLVVKPDGQVTQTSMKAALAKRFESRIDWEKLALLEPKAVTPDEGEKRLIDGIWHEFIGGRWLVDDGANYDKLDASQYGAESYDDLRNKLTSSEGLLTLEQRQLERVWQDFPGSIPPEYRDTIRFAMSQKPALRERVLRGSIIGARIRVIQDKIATGYNAGDLDLELADMQRQIGEEIARTGNPHHGRSASVKGNGAANWLKYKASVTKDGELTALMTGTLEAGTAKAYDGTDHEQVLRHLFNQIDLDPIELSTFRAAYEGELPAGDNELLNLLAQKDGIAVQPDGTLIPMDRATSGDIGALNSTLLGALAGTPEGAIKDNYLKQLEEIKQRRKWTDIDDIDFSLNSRWFDRRLIMEFLHERGFDDVKYIKDVQVENGALVSESGYSGRDGVFTGYRYKTVQSRDKETRKSTFTYKRVRNSDGFLDQFENYLNGVKPRGVNANAYLERIQSLEQDFNIWIRQHDEIDDVVQDYNDAFNAFIPFSHSEENLNLQGISGARVPFTYQNGEVRRLSEDGRGILGFGTGLGKTTTALALEAYNYENGRSKRTATVVPKAVYQNWYYEAQEFYSKDALANMLFVGLDEVRGDDGNIKQIPVLTPRGQPVINDKTGLPVYRNAMVEASAETIKERMNMIPMSNYRHVIMTKEQFAAIPLRQETVEEHAREVLFAEAEAGRVNLAGTKHRDAAKKNSILSKASDTGSAKAVDYPFFEDMSFDSVIADEGHNYRNSYSTGREASQLAYLPTSAVAKSARDMALKSSYLMKKYNGRGPVVLTATPLVNSPVDAFNMLSHVVSSTEWQRMGILTPDDFVKVFGLTEEVSVQKISGEIERKQGLVGFKNLDGLRGIFHRWTTLKTAQDVSDTVKIPELSEKNVAVPMTKDQAAIYEALRQRADDLSNGRNDEGNEEDKDSIFAIIRDMDRVCIDPDLYRRQMTFRFPADKKESVVALVDALPVSVKATDDDEEKESVTVNVTAKMTVTGDFVEIIVPESAEDEIMKRLSKYGLSDSDVSHPVPPKYSALIENLRAGLVDGKQIIFTDEKTQHNKLRRILAASLNLEQDDIGILNATTVADAGKKGKAPKAVKEPKEPKDDASEDELDAYYQAKEAYDTYIASKTESSLSGMEKIASDYNEGRTLTLICNKKAEVGINLHHGTSDIHHLTLPWTPASIDQRNGRGARVGSEASTVRVHYYCGKGSFDEFRLNTLKRKKNWITDILTSDQARMANADANSQEEMQLLLAADPEDYARRTQAAKDKAEAAARAAATKRANIDLDELVKMQHATKISADKVRSDLEFAILRLASAKSSLETEMTSLQEALDNGREYAEKQARADIDTMQGIIKQQSAAVRRYERQLVRSEKAESRIKLLRPEVERAIAKGLIDVDLDILTHGDKYALLAGGRVLKKGGIYKKFEGSDVYVRITSLNLDEGVAQCDEIFSHKGGGSLRTALSLAFESIGGPSDVPEAEASLREWSAGEQYIYSVADRMTKAEFVEYQRNGWLVLKDTHIVYRDAAGVLQSEMIRESQSYGYGKALKPSAIKWIQTNADNIVYPDTADSELKSAAAGWYRSTRSSFGTDGFMIALFGRGFQSEIKNYGEVASNGVIETIVAEHLSVSLNGSDRDGRTFNGEGKMQYGQYLITGKYDPEQYMERAVQPQITRFIPEQYKNIDDFKAVLKTQYRAKVQEHFDAVVNAAKEHAHKAWLDYLDELKAPVEEVIEMFESISPNATQMQASYRAWRRGGGAYDFDAYGLPQLYAHAVRLGFVEQSSITEGAFSAAEQMQNTLANIDASFAEKAKDREAVLLELKAKSGLISDEEIAAAQARRTERESEVTAEKSALDDSGLTVKKNSQALTGGKGSNRYNYAPDEAICLQDEAGKDGALYRAKDEIKTQFGAKYHNGKISGQELMGSWWIISAEHKLDDVLAVISSFK